VILLGEGEEERHGVGIFLIFRIESVSLLVAQLQTLCGIVHNESDETQRDQYDDPLGTLYGAYAGYGDTNPEQHFREVVGAAYIFIQPGVAEPLGVHLLRCGFLFVRGGFAENGESHDDDSDPCEDIVGSAVHDAVGDSGGLSRVHEHGVDPHEGGYRDGHRFRGTGGFQRLLVGSVGQLTLEDVAAKAISVDDKQCGHDRCSSGESAIDETEDQVEDADAHHGEAVTNRHEPHEFLKSHAASEGSYQGHAPHECRPDFSDIGRIQTKHYLLPPKYSLIYSAKEASPVSSLPTRS